MSREAHLHDSKPAAEYLFLRFTLFVSPLGRRRRSDRKYLNNSVTYETRNEKRRNTNSVRQMTSQLTEALIMHVFTRGKYENNARRAFAHRG